MQRCRRVEIVDPLIVNKSSRGSRGKLPEFRGSFTEEVSAAVRSIPRVPRLLLLFGPIDHAARRTATQPRSTKEQRQLYIDAR